MNDRYNEYCMKFTNEELKIFLVDYVIKNAKAELNIRLLSEEGEEIEYNSDERIETIVFDGKNENLFINLMGVHTSIFVFEHEIMFIDERSKGIYTSSDVYDNVVYEGDLRAMSHEQMLQMFADIVICLADATTVEVLQADIIENERYKRYPYYEPHMFIINVESKHKAGKVKVYENITINY